MEKVVQADLRWRFDAGRSLYQWYGSVQIVDRYALGQWFCVDLDTGNCLWEKRFGRANTICGVTDGVIIASETRSDGSWTVDFGVYAFSLESGNPLWVSHREGLAGTICSLLDRVPRFTNELRDRPKHVQGREVICQSGRVLDVRSGSLLRRLSLEPETPKRVSFETEKRVALPVGELLISGPTPQEHRRFVISCTVAGHETWRFNVKGTNRFIEGNARSWRVVGDRIYLVISDGPMNVPIRAENPFIVRRAARQFELWILDATTGDVRQKAPIEGAPVEECRIEDVSDRYLLVSTNNKRLHCYTHEVADGPDARLEIPQP
jgi:outer membrane protein assembly factor BamB